MNIAGNLVDWYVVFILVMILVFALCSILAGLFTAYFGAGKSRKIGVGLILLGLILGIVFVVPDVRRIHGFFTEAWMLELIIYAGVFILAAVVGLLLALGLFLVAIMKS